MNNEICTDVMSEISVKNSLINHLEKENDDLKVKLEQLGLWSDEKMAMIDELKAELNNKQVTIQDLDGVIMGLEEDNKNLMGACRLLKDTSHYPKEYQAEADEYFSHNPKAKEVYFFMITDYDMKDAESGDLMLSEDDAICIINNERSN